LSQDGERFLDAGERAVIADHVAALRSAIAGTDANTIKQEMTALNHITEDFAGRRMDASISQALTGHKLEELG
jgi:molecular chaperone HscA